MKCLKKTLASKVMVITLALCFGCHATSELGSVHYSNPPWAPAYHQGVRYYYLPDIEVYYDLSNQQFVYFNNRRWLFSPTLPSIYAGYDLFNGFVIALNFRVSQPWLHHRVYVSNYPRYYYRDFYRRRDISKVRWFNENDRRRFSWKQDDHNRGDDHYRNDNRRDNQPKNKPERNTGITRPQRTPAQAKKDVGRPVKVTPPMRAYKPGAPRPEQ